MAILNITYNGLSVDYPLQGDARLSDADVRRIAVELVRSGGLRGLVIANLPEHAFDHYVVDRFPNPHGGERIYLRPKVPFGAG
jgi:hypothetical protein